ncbi:MAG: hypothetical protein RMK89_04400 [Armatimonadota bacterium]|nr:hypothetical protein [Armatimonadota bacterium]MDW8142687.1 hypothetical protein [Armatimonadota bacterium]
MVRKRILLMLLAVLAGLAPLGIALPIGDVLFVKVVEIGCEGVYARKAALLPKGEVIYFWEQTRPPNDEEKRLRALWFDEQWEAFRKRAEQKGIPEIERKSQAIAKELEVELAKQPPVIRSLQPFFSAATRGLPMLMRQALKMAFPIARQHFINQPVVLSAGLKIRHPDGREEGIQVDVEKLYGEETWMRIPAEEINLRTSPDGRFLALETSEEFIVLFEFRENAFSPLAQVRGQSPIGWSHDSRFMFVTRSPKRDTFAVYKMDGLSEVGSFGPVQRPVKGFSDIRTVAISNELLAVGGGNILCVYRLADGSVKQADRRTLGRIGGAPDSVINGLVFSPDGRKLYVASARGFFVIDPHTFAVLEEYILPAKAGFSFDKLADVSPDGRYAAVLYGRERLYGWATLFFWDIRGKRVIQKIGTEQGKMLDTISKGFRFIYPPANLTKDWLFLLVTRQDGVLELYRRR